MPTTPTCTCYVHPLTGKPSTRERREGCAAHGTTTPHTPGPCSRARIVGTDVVIPCAGVVQAIAVLPMIIAAPRLLAALEALVTEHDDTYHDGGECGATRILAARAALRAAKGEE